MHGSANMDQMQVKLRWNGYASVFSDSLHKYFNQPKFADAMIACDGRLFMVHRIILSMCSDYFNEIFELLPNDNTRPVIVLNEAPADNVAAILSYMYRGEVNVAKSSLSQLFELMKYLKIKGLLHFQDFDDQIQNKASIGTIENKEISVENHRPKEKQKSLKLKRKSSTSHLESKKARRTSSKKNILALQSDSSLTLTNTTTTTACSPSLPAGSITVLNSIQPGGGGGPVVSIPLNSMPAELQASANASLKCMPLLAAHLMGRPNHMPKTKLMEEISVSTNGTEDSSYKFLPASSDANQLLVDIKDEVKEEPLTLGPDDPLTQDDYDDYWNGDEEANSLSDISTECIQPVSPSMATFSTIAESHTFTVSPSLTDPHTLTVSSSLTESSALNLPPRTATGLGMPMMTVRIPVPPISPPVEVSKELPTVPVESPVAVAPVRSSHVLPQILPKPVYGTTSYVTTKESSKKPKPPEESSKPDQSNFTVRVKSFSSLTNLKDSPRDLEKSPEPPVVEIPETDDEIELPPINQSPQKRTSLDGENSQISEEELGIKEMMQLINEGMDDQSINFMSVSSEKRRNPPYLIHGNRITTKNAEPVKFRLTGAAPNQVISICMRYSEEKFKNYPVIVCRLHQTFEENCNFRVSNNGSSTCTYNIETGHPTAFLTLSENDISSLGCFEFFVTFTCLNSCHKEYGKKMELVLKLMDSSKSTVSRVSRHEVRVCRNVKRDYKEALQGEDSCLKVLVRPESLLYPDEPEALNLSAGDVKAQLVNSNNRSQSLENTTIENDNLPALPSLSGPVSEPQPQEFYLIRLPNSKKGKMLLNLVKEFDRNIPDLESIAPVQAPEDKCPDS